jgi:hypothetical protein
MNCLSELPSLNSEPVAHVSRWIPSLIPDYVAQRDQPLVAYPAVRSS